MTEARPVDDGRCFACGPYNADGMHLRFERTGDQEVQARITLPPRFQGWRGTAHGGVVMTLLDEAMAHACGAIGEQAMTASMALRFRAPVPLGQLLLVTGTVKWKRRQVIALDATVADASGEVLASAEGSFVSLGPLAQELYGTRNATSA